MSIESMTKDFIITDPDVYDNLKKDLEAALEMPKYELKHPTSLEIGEKVLKEFLFR